MDYLKIILLLFFLTGAQSCTKNETLPFFENPKNFTEVFESFWFEMNKNYLFWDQEKVKWNDIYMKYKPLFMTLDLSSPSDLRKSVGYFREMTDSLKDGHFSISFSPSPIKDSIIYPSFFRIKNKKIPQISYVKTDTAYLDPGFMFAADNNFSSNGVPLLAICGTINSNILFFQCSSFNLFKSYTSRSQNSIKAVLDHFFFLLDNSANLKGIIIDIRNNQGGDLTDLNFFAGRLINNPLHFGYTRYKTGNEQLNFSPWIKSFVNPSGNNSIDHLTKIVLSDKYSASMSEMVMLAIKALPSSFVVGDTSWGATGAIVSKELYNSGQFTIGGFMNVIQSSISFKFINNKTYEGIGFPPDYPMAASLTELASGRDKQLEKAISLIK